jgi:hypothetical protein
MRSHISDVDFECPAEIRVLLGPVLVLTVRTELELRSWRPCNGVADLG